MPKGNSLKHRGDIPISVGALLALMVAWLGPVPCKEWVEAEKIGSDVPCF